MESLLVKIIEVSYEQHFTKGYSRIGGSKVTQIWRMKTRGDLGHSKVLLYQAAATIILYSVSQYSEL